MTTYFSGSHLLFICQHEREKPWQNRFDDPDRYPGYEQYTAAKKDLERERGEITTHATKNFLQLMNNNAAKSLCSTESTTKETTVHPKYSVTDHLTLPTN